MTRIMYECDVCGAEFNEEESLRGHLAILMETNSTSSDPHPHWDDLPVSHGDLSAWEKEGTDLSDFF